MFGFLSIHASSHLDGRIAFIYMQRWRHEMQTDKSARETAPHSCDFECTCSALAYMLACSRCHRGSLSHSSSEAWTSVTIMSPGLYSTVASTLLDCSRAFMRDTKRKWECIVYSRRLEWHSNWEPIWQVNCMLSLARLHSLHHSTLLFDT